MLVTLISRLFRRLGQLCTVSTLNALRIVITYCDCRSKNRSESTFHLNSDEDYTLCLVSCQ